MNRGETGASRMELLTPDPRAPLPGIVTGMGVFGYSQADGVYTYVGFHGGGTSRSLRGTLQDGIWRFFGQSDRGPAWRRFQVTISPNEDGLHFLEESSERGGAWQKRLEQQYLRVK
jgi:hypothetical protein